MTQDTEFNQKVEIDNSSVQELQQKAEWLKDKIGESIEHAQEMKRTNQRRASYIRIAAVLLSGIITVLLGLQIEGFEESFRTSAFVLGAFVTVLNALEPFFNFRALWVEHEAALASFHRLEERLEFYLVGIEPENLNRKELKELNEKYQRIWVDLSRTWVEYRKSESSPV